MKVRSGWRFKRRLAITLCAFGVAAFWIWSEQTRVGPVRARLQDHPLNAEEVAELALEDVSVEDVVVRLNQILANHSDLRNLKVIIWDRPLSPRGFRRLLIRKPPLLPDQVQSVESSSSLRFSRPDPGQPSVFAKRRLSIRFSGRQNLGDVLFWVEALCGTENAKCTFGQQGNLLYLVETAGTFEPLLTREYAIDSNKFGDEPEAFLKRAGLLAYEGCSAQFVEPGKLKVRTVKDETVQLAKFGLQPIPTFLARWQDRWNALWRE